MSLEREEKKGVSMIWGEDRETDRGGEESVPLITLCDTLDYRGASQCNIRFY